jgi:hypothetical protein
MALCDFITAGRGKNCKSSIGGVGKLFLFQGVEDAFTVVAGEVTAINPLVTAVYGFELEGDGNNVAENLVSDRNAGTSVNTQTITSILKKVDAVTSAELNLLAYSFPMAVVRDRNGVFHAIGIDDGIDFSVASATGGAKADLNGFTLTGVSTTNALSPKLDATTVTAFLALAV